MKVCELMSVETHRISSSAMLCEAADRMRACGTTALPVVEDRRIVGLIMEQALTAAALPGGVDPRFTPVRSVMTSAVVCCSQEDGVEKAMEIAESGHTRWLIVLDCCGAAVGVLSVEELASKAAERSVTEP